MDRAGACVDEAARPRANRSRLAATKFPLKHLNSDSKAAARIMLTIQREPYRALKGNRCHELFSGQFAPGSTNATAAMTLV